MKKVFVALMCMASLVIMTACGGGNAKKDSVGEAVEKAKEVKKNASDLDKGNCLEIAKDNYGVSVPSFDGCEIADAKSMSRNPSRNMDITYKVTGDFDATASKVLSQLFESTSKVSPDGNYKPEMDFNTNKVKFSEKKFGKVEDAFIVNQAGKSYVASWNYTSGDMIEMVNVNASPKEIVISFTKGGKR